MPQLSNSISDWEECKPGSLAGYAARDKSRKRNRDIIKLISVASLCVAAIFASVASLQPTDTRLEPNYGGIVCSKVISYSRAFIAGTLDQETNSKIEEHLQRCPQCWSAMKHRRESQVDHAPYEIHPHRFISTTDSLDLE